MKKKRSITSLICFWNGLALLASMGICIGIQLFLRPRGSALDGAIHDIGHLLVIGGVVYAASVITVRRVMLRPLNEIFLHLYEAGKGQPAPLPLDSGCKELQTVVDGINTMVWRMEQEDDARWQTGALGSEAEPAVDRRPQTISLLESQG